MVFTPASSSTLFSSHLHQNSNKKIYPFFFFILSRRIQCRSSDPRLTEWRQAADRPARWRCEMLDRGLTIDGLIFLSRSLKLNLYHMCACVRMIFLAKHQASSLSVSLAHPPSKSSSVLNMANIEERTSNQECQCFLHQAYTISLPISKINSRDCDGNASCFSKPQKGSSFVSKRFEFMSLQTCFEINN